MMTKGRRYALLYSEELANGCQTAVTPAVVKINKPQYMNAMYTHTQGWKSWNVYVFCRTIARLRQLPSNKISSSQVSLSLLACASTLYELSLLGSQEFVDTEYPHIFKLLLYRITTLNNMTDNKSCFSFLLCHRTLCCGYFFASVRILNDVCNIHFLEH